MDTPGEQTLVEALTVEQPPAPGSRWKVTPHEDLPGWFWAAAVDDEHGMPSFGDSLLCGPRGRRLTLSSSPLFRGPLETVEVIRELGDSNLSDEELEAEIYVRVTARQAGPTA